MARSARSTPSLVTMSPRRTTRSTTGHVLEKRESNFQGGGIPDSCCLVVGSGHQSVAGGVETGRHGNAVMACKPGNANIAFADVAWASLSAVIPRNAANSVPMRGNSPGSLRPCALPAARWPAVV